MNEWAWKLDGWTHQRSPDGWLPVWPSSSGVVGTAETPGTSSWTNRCSPLQHWNVQLYPYRNWFVPQPEGESELDCFIKPYLQRTSTEWRWHEGRVGCAGVLCKYVWVDCTITYVDVSKEPCNLCRYILSSSEQMTRNTVKGVSVFQTAGRLSLTIV